MTKILFNDVPPSEIVLQAGALRLELYLLNHQHLRDVELSLSLGPGENMFTAMISGFFRDGSSPRTVSRSATTLYLAIHLVGEAFEDSFNLTQTENVYDERL